ncbi:hypothetical protein Ddye_026670 [Dipteronia dyeriana]|uniref:Uncharacterized protein n=1 Tax=Dipteronia dyeriana TaxID=168575 RepID=A0AAD9TNN8_9ROSI|nr:hypothetical protein Ddye_026670 [Dipteronia dyeriana]
MENMSASSGFAVAVLVAVVSLSLILNKSSGYLGGCFGCFQDSDYGDSFEDPDSGFGVFPVPAFNGDNFCLMGGGGGFTTTSLLSLTDNFFLLLLVQLLPPH